MRVMPFKELVVEVSEITFGRLSEGACGGVGVMFKFDEVVG